MEIYSPNPTDFLNIERAISCIKEDRRWRFSESGAVQAFEDSSLYSALKIKDRFTPATLKAYAEAIGIEAFDPSYYSPERGFFLIEKNGAAAKNMGTYSLSEARAAGR
ncbi:hypothetical protein [Burkholderia sp. Ac-20379]|uniref:hypothetical protein n=1 Tax=Burkholderia sp. Ac-20379 TaxID=2703900 RepID=UPI00197ED777|nr:hypothetical protein [Burkholderia sp. Ac-20379]MBN3723698.1 hypothetical protein [Burkholderia sp. Ac-20379]